MLASVSEDNQSTAYYKDRKEFCLSQTEDWPGHPLPRLLLRNCSGEVWFPALVCISCQNKEHETSQGYMSRRPPPTSMHTASQHGLAPGKGILSLKEDQHWVLWRREWLPSPVFLPGEFHGLDSPWGHKELDRTE